MELSSQPTVFPPESSSTPVKKIRVGRPRKVSKFHGNRYRKKASQTPRSMNLRLPDANNLHSNFPGVVIVLNSQSLTPYEDEM